MAEFLIFFSTIFLFIMFIIFKRIIDFVDERRENEIRKKTEINKNTMGEVKDDYPK